MIRKICAVCKTTKNVHIHHKDKNHENDDIENLIELCAVCHSKIHTNRLSLSDVGLESAHISETLYNNLQHSTCNYIRLRRDVLKSILYMLSETAVGVSGNPAVEPKKKTTYVNEILMNALACPATKHFVFSENIQGEIEELAFKPGDRITICRAGTVGHYPPKDRVPEPASEPLPRQKAEATNGAE